MKITETYETVEKTWDLKNQETNRRKEEIRQRIHRQTNDKEKARESFRPAKPVPAIDDETRKNVAVYARVSTSSEQQVSSIENQTIYYQKKIEDAQNWELQEIYSDEGKSGTSKRKRVALERLLNDAKQKKMNMVVCASVSRLARNVSDCLEIVSDLKTMNPAHPIGVYFETENIYTLNPDSDQALGLHALLADWESANKSRRMILSYDQRILTGQYPVADLLGYRHTKDGELVVVEEEAKTIRFIFLAFLCGYCYEKIAGILTEKKRATMKGRVEWNADMVSNVMENERRWGELEARKTIVVDYKHGKTTKNRNDRCSAYVLNHHEPIVSPAIAKAVKYVKGTNAVNRKGLCETYLIKEGALNGFINIEPAWAGISVEMLMEICKSCSNELSENKKLENEKSGFVVSVGSTCFTPNVPLLKISRNRLFFNVACRRKLNFAKEVAIYFHPILKIIVIRETVRDENAVTWIDKSGKMKELASGSFCKALFSLMNWQQDEVFHIRGIMKERSGKRIMFFYLDEGHKRAGNHVWENYENIQWKHRIEESISEKDIVQIAAAVCNPLIGEIPTKVEMKHEIELLLGEM